jgi:hypothetical protein
VTAVVAAFLTPPDVVSMTMLLLPLMLLYEVGIGVGKLVWRRERPPGIGAVLLLLALAGLWPGEAGGAGAPAPSGGRSGPTRPGSWTPWDRVSGPIRSRAPDPARRWIPPPRAGSDCRPRPPARSRTPTPPSRPCCSSPAIASSLRRRQRRLYADSQAVELVGRALVEQQGSTLEADTVRLRQAACRMEAEGKPSLFEEGTVLTGSRMRYDTCERRGFVEGALTNFEQSGVDWYLRGGLSVDSASVRLFASSADLTSCDLPDPHYHFSSGSVKWVNNTMLVARPATLYVRDVPVLWLPFIIQDMRPRPPQRVPGAPVRDQRPGPAPTRATRGTSRTSATTSR